MPRRVDLLDADELLEALSTTARHARAAGALKPMATQLECLSAGGVDYVLRIVDGLSRKPVSGELPAAQPRRNPFLPHDAALYVGHWPPRHLLLLNKFPVLEPHLLLVTVAYEPQSAPLTLADQAAAAALLRRLGGLVFYNAGAVAGGSQPHRHLQWVDTALAPGLRELPIGARATEALIGAAPGIEVRAELQFRHVLCALPSLQAEDLHACYRSLLRALGLDPDAEICDGYNMLLTPRWMMLVPRTRAAVAGIGINALAFAGALLLHDSAQLSTLKSLGVQEVLRTVTA